MIDALIRPRTSTSPRIRKYAVEHPLVGLEPEVHPDRDRHRARRHAQVDRQACAASSPSSSRTSPFGCRPQHEPATPADAHDREPERRFLRAEVEADRQRVAQEGDAGVGAERDVLEAEHADRDVGQRQVEARRGALRRSRRRTAGPRSRRTGSARAAGRRTTAARGTRCRRTRRRSRASRTTRRGSRSVGTMQLHQPGVAVADEVQVEVDDLREDVHRRWRASPTPEPRRRAAGSRASA